MNVNSSKRGAAAVIAIASIVTSLAGCSGDSKNSQSQISGNTSQAVSEVNSNENPEIAETSDNADFIEEIDGEEIFDFDFEILEENDFSYYVMDDVVYIDSYNGDAETVTVPDKLGGYPVENVNLYSFSYNEKTKKLIIPDTVTQINVSVFDCALESIEVSDKNENYSTSDGVLFNKDKTVLLYYPCAKSGNYTIPDTVESVEEYAFVSCSKLKTLTLSKNLKDINGYSFGSCQNLTEFKISGDNENYSVKEGILYNKSGDELVMYPTGKSGDFKMPDTVKSVGVYAFSYAPNIEKIELSNNLTELGESAFESCTSLKEVKFGNNLKTIGNNAFSSCENLSKIELPESLTTLGSYAFLSCNSLTEVNIPENISAIAPDSFAYCENLKKITVNENNKNFTVKDNVLYDKDITNIVLYPSSREGDYDIPEGVTSIGMDTFYYCKDLTKISIPSSVTSIDEFAFQYCLSLKAVDVSSDNKNYTSVGGVLYNNEKTEILCVPTAFDGEVEITAEVETISTDLFYNSFNCKGFKVDSANKNYTSVDGVLFNKDKTQLVKSPSTQKGEYTVPKGVKEIGECAFFGCNEVTSVKISEGVESILDNVFDSCSAEKIYIPKSVTAIGMNALTDNGNLMDIYYAGSEKDWEKINVDSSNSAFDSQIVKINYNSKY